MHHCLAAPSNDPKANHGERLHFLILSIFWKAANHSPHRALHGIASTLSKYAAPSPDFVGYVLGSVGGARIAQASLQAWADMLSPLLQVSLTSEKSLLSDGGRHLWRARFKTYAKNQGLSYFLPFPD